MLSRSEWEGYKNRTSGQCESRTQQQYPPSGELKEAEHMTG